MNEEEFQVFKSSYIGDQIKYQQSLKIQAMAKELGHMKGRIAALENLLSKYNPDWEDDFFDLKLDE